MALQSQLGAELQRVIHAELAELKRELGNQKRVAEALNVAPSTVSKALRRKRAGGELLDSILKFRGATAAGLFEKHAVAVATCGNSIASDTERSERDVSYQLTELTMAAALFHWDSTLRADERLVVLRKVVEMVTRWGRSQMPDVQMWSDLLTGKQGEVLARRLLIEAAENEKRARTSHAGPSVACTRETLEESESSVA